MTDTDPTTDETMAQGADAAVDDEPQPEPSDASEGLAEAGSAPVVLTAEVSP